MTVDCIIFKVDGSKVKHPAEAGSSHVALINTVTGDKEAYFTSDYTDKSAYGHPVYKIAYQERPSDDVIKAAIDELEPFPMQLKK